MASKSERYACDIYDGAKAAGATPEMLATYELTKADCEWIEDRERESLSAPEVHPDQRPASRGEADALMEDVDLRGLYAEVQREVRVLARSSE